MARPKGTYSLDQPLTKIIGFRVRESTFLRFQSLISRKDRNNFLRDLLNEKLDEIDSQSEP